MTTELPISALVTRTELGMADLNINDATTYRVAGPSAMGGQVSWVRQQVSAPWVDGDITVARRRQNVMEPLTLYIKGSSQADMDTKIATLIQAFTQHRYGLQIVVGGANHAWDCEAADYQVTLDTVHFHALYAQATFQIPRKPVALSGAF
jgi:dienelactone hydrolase